MLLKKDLVHYLAGLLTGLTAFINSLLAILTFISFLVYELDEDWHIRDKAYRDIKIYALGLYTVAIYKIIKNILLHGL